MAINFGSIGRRRCITFKVSEDGYVMPAKLRRDWTNSALDYSFLADMGELITARESFRRWKISRKAWNTRRGNKQQLTLPL